VKKPKWWESAMNLGFAGSVVAKRWRPADCGPIKGKLTVAGRSAVLNRLVHNPKVAGSNPAPATNLPLFLLSFSRSGDQGCHAVATVEESNRTLDRGWAEVHVPLRRREVLMSGKFLDGPCRRPTHRQMRAERVSKDVDALVL
jgi:hypothetical protein